MTDLLNLTEVIPTGKNAPSAMSIAVNSATSRVNGWSYDANGNTTGKPGFSGSYDVEKGARGRAARSITATARIIGGCTRVS